MSSGRSARWGSLDGAADAATLLSSPGFATTTFAALGALGNGRAWVRGESIGTTLVASILFVAAGLATEP
jgi:hypothetical protein